MDGPRIAAHLALGTVPFAVLLPADLGPNITDPDLFQKDGRHVTDTVYNKLGKLMYLATDKLWVIGNIPELSDHRDIFFEEILTPAPLTCNATAVDDDPDIPSTLEDWRAAQRVDADLLAPYKDGSTLLQDGLHLFADPDFPTLIIVPHHLREPLARQHHAQLHTSLARHYHWPSMRRDIRNWLSNCEFCENEKARRRKAHSMFSARPSVGPRSRYSMDYQGQGTASSGERKRMFRHH